MFMCLRSISTHAVYTKREKKDKEELGEEREEKKINIKGFIGLTKEAATLGIFINSSGFLL